MEQVVKTKHLFEQVDEVKVVRTTYKITIPCERGFWGWELESALKELPDSAKFYKQEPGSSEIVLIFVDEREE